ncbi:MAG: ABC-F family ATP-binding cassette domain-containing protein [Nocardioides sp.]|uniref:ABC-F family ATP-binding cassette domain-containing protein n=1 Tax=Nocardioides sp. TaxID=35761 RepID=UPI0039E3AC31
MSNPAAATLRPVVVRDLSVAFRDREVLTGIDLVGQPGRRIGLVGENGVGKSTLLRAIAGDLPRLARATGQVDRPDDLAMLGQEPPFGESDTVAEVLAMALAPLHEAVAAVEKLASELDRPDAGAAYACALDWAVAHDAWDADRRAAAAAERLGLGLLDPQRRIGTLSGGQRTRLALASLMTTRPSALLLDEPTNHLDDDAITVLGEFVVSLPGVVLLASHDRVLLDDVCTDLVDLDPAELGTDGFGGRRYGGGWSEYVDHRQAARRRWEETYAQQQDQIADLRATSRIGTGAIAHDRRPRDNDRFIYGFKGTRVDRTLARRKKDAQRRLEEAERGQVRKPPARLVFAAPLPESGGGDGRVIVVRDLVVPDRIELARLDVHAGEHVLVAGPNGSGKSTLLGVLSGRLAGWRGTVQVTARRVAELEQDPRFVDPRRSAEATYRVAVGEQLADQRPLRGLGLLPPADLRKPVALLSVGQRRRLSLALAIAATPDLLLLDEPTNHLSLSLADELETALQRSPGTVVVATHDRWLRRRWQGSVVAL